MTAATNRISIENLFNPVILYLFEKVQIFHSVCAWCISNISCDSIHCVENTVENLSNICVENMKTISASMWSKRYLLRVKWSYIIVVYKLEPAAICVPTNVASENIKLVVIITYSCRMNFPCCSLYLDAFFWWNIDSSMSPT